MRRRNPNVSPVTRAVCRILCTTPPTHTMDGLKALVAELLYDDSGGSLTNAAFVESILEANEYLNPLGLQVFSDGDTIKLTNTPIEDPKINAHIRENNPNTGYFRLTESEIEVLAMIAVKQPVTMLEIEQIAGTDRYRQVTRLRALGFITSVRNARGTNEWSTTSKFQETWGTPRQVFGEEFPEHFPAEQ